jgi:hypothetical protein
MAKGNGTKKTQTVPRTAVSLEAEAALDALTGAPAVTGAAPAAPAPKQHVIELPKLTIERAKITLIGDSPLISHRWSEKARAQMLGKQMKTAKGAKEAKDPWQDYVGSMYWLSPIPDDPSPDDIAEAKFGFPVIAFKAAAVDACSHVDGVTKVEARGAFHIDGEMAEIDGHPNMREDMVRVGMGTADIRYRGEFKEWRTTLTIRYNKNVLSLDQITNLFNTAGFAIGVGEWRPQRDGSYGMYHVATAEEATGK